MRPISLLLLSLAACAGTATEDPVVDADGDGSPAGADCDDANDTIYPGADELCDGKDNDCDDAVDEEPVNGVTAYVDSDGDGYGNDEQTATVCEAGSGYSLQGGDCDDEDAAYHPDAVEDDCEDPNDYNCDGSTGYADADGDGFPACQDCDDGNANINPDAEEVCNGEDDDCDGRTDDRSASDAQTWYGDEDGDGYGNSADTTVACDAPPGTSTLSGDCNDENPDVHPGAAEECDDTVDYNCDGFTGYADADGDGYAACEECDDGNSEVHPGATETCNGIDDDCDSSVDEVGATGSSVYYPDADADGFGASSGATLACDEPPGYADNDDDCDDTDADAFPGAVEACDGDDEDCDGNVDEDGTPDGTPVYADDDGDGYGDDDAATTTCSLGEGWSEDGGDCDDGDRDIHPGATELCNGDDDDCDGEIDEDSADADMYYLDADVDGYGDPSVMTTSCDPVDRYVANDEDCDDDDETVNPDADEVCGGGDEDCDGDIDDDDDDVTGTTRSYDDGDGDGYGDPADFSDACTTPAGNVANDDDCDDADDTVNPFGTEMCDGVDNDCDSAVDESSAVDADVYYRDADGDGYGNPASTVMSCSPVAEYVSNGEDCDDTNSTINPDATEVCDLVDNDCDGDVDEGSPDAATYYYDGDGDGFGDPANSVDACGAPAMYVANDDDCDDIDPEVSPAADEICDDVDNDCDGSIDEASAVDVTTWYLDFDGDGYGGSTFTLTQCDMPAGYVDQAGDCDDGDDGINPSVDEACDGYDNDCDGTIDIGPGLGDAVYADVDGDGYGDPESSVEACDGAAGYVDDATDCDDSNATVNPGADEICDDLDNDCEGTIDVSAVDAPYFPDVDGDGFGDDSADGLCEATVGYVKDDSDCDDNDIEFHPYAWEFPGDLEDTDCDGNNHTYEGYAVASVRTTAATGDTASTEIAFAGGAFMESFTLCGTEYTSVYMTTDGRLTFGADDPDGSETVSELQADTMIGPAWDNLYVTGTSSAYMYAVAFADAYGFYWRGIPEYDGTSTSGSNTFSVILQDNGRVIFQYDAMSLTGSIAGWSCAPGSGTSEVDLSATMDALGAGEWGISGATSTYTYERFGSGDQDLENTVVRFCVNTDGVTDTCSE